MVENGDFANGSDGWWSNYPGAVFDEQFCARVLASARRPWQFQVGFIDLLTLDAGTEYEVSFDIRSDRNAWRDVQLKIQQQGTWRTIEVVPVRTTLATQRLTSTFTVPDSVLNGADRINNAQLLFQLGNGTPNRYCVDNVSLRPVDTVSPPTELLTNPDFDAGLDGWWDNGGVSSAVDGAACITIPEGTTRSWQVQIGQGGIDVSAEHSYRLEAEFTGPAETELILFLSTEAPLANGQWYAYDSRTVRLDGGTTFVQSQPIRLVDQGDAAVIVHLGGNPASTVCIDRLSLLRIPG